MIKKELLNCQCSSGNHIITFNYDSDDNEVYCNVYVEQNKPLHKRIWYAIKYIFGWQSNYGAYSEIILRPEDADALNDIAAHLDKVTEENYRRAAEQW